MFKKICVVLMISFLFGINVYAVDNWTKASPAGTDSPSDIDDKIQANNNCLDRLLNRYKRGCDVVYGSSTTITVSTGNITTHNAADPDIEMREVDSAVTVTMATDIDTAPEANDTWYYVYLDGDTAETGISSGVFSLSSSAPTGVTSYRLVGAVRNDSSGDFMKTYRNGSTVFYSDPPVATTTESEAAWTTLDLSDYVPAGVSNQVILGIYGQSTSGSNNIYALVRPYGSSWSYTDVGLRFYDQTSDASTEECAFGNQATVYVDSSSRIEYYTYSCDSDFEIIVIGWVENLPR